VQQTIKSQPVSASDRNCLGLAAHVTQSVCTGV